MKTSAFEWPWINGNQGHQEYSSTAADNMGSTTDKYTAMIS
jgi:hypothetical protein